MYTPIEVLPTMNLGCAEIISISYTELTNLDTKPLLQLLELYISGCKITNVDFSACSKLTKLSACESSLIAIEVESIDFKFALKELYLSNSEVGHAEFGKMPYLEKLWIDGT